MTISKLSALSNNNDKVLGGDSLKNVAIKLSNDLEVDKDVLLRYVKLYEDVVDMKVKLKGLASKCAYMLDHEDWILLAGRIETYSIKLDAPKTFSEYVTQCRTLFNKEAYRFLKDNADTLGEMIVDDRDYRFDYLAINTLKKTYLWSKTIMRKKVTMETPQYMYMRMAVQMYMDSETSEGVFRCIKNAYDELSAKDGANPLYTHASPTMFNSCARRPQLGSCFLTTIPDSIEGISKKAWHDVAIISKNGGGLGIDISSIRHSEIAEAGESGGIIPLLRVVNTILTYIDQAGKRKGSATIYLADWHKDIFEFLELKKEEGSEYLRARDLFYNMWTSDLFMKRVYQDKRWSLFCPNKAKGLNDVYGVEFEMLYTKYEEAGMYDRQVQARDLWMACFVSQVEVSMPFRCYKDAINRMSNQKNLGTIKQSNLCLEITEFSSEDEIASCNLASVCLDSCLQPYNSESPPNYNEKHLFINTRLSRYNDYKPVFFDFGVLEMAIRKLVHNLNQVIDRTWYPDEIPEVKYANLKNRPMGIGVHGLADTFARLDMPFTSPEAKRLNILMFETIYYAFVSESVIISETRLKTYESTIEPIRKQIGEAKKKGNASEVMMLERSLYGIQSLWEGGPYRSFKGSPASKGEFHFDMWRECKIEKEMFKLTNSSKDVAGCMKKAIDTVNEQLNTYLSTSCPRYDWNELRKRMVKYGMFNSLGIALMPTASSAQINRRNESFEPFQELIFTRTVLSGQFIVLNRYAVADLREIGMWTTAIIKSVIDNQGSMQHIECSNEQHIDRFNFLKEKYRTAYEMPQSELVQMHLDRGVFVDQTASFNVYDSDPSYRKMTTLLFDQWFGCAKTAIYYLRGKPSSRAKNYAANSIDSGESITGAETEGSLESKKDIVCNGDVCSACVL